MIITIDGPVATGKSTIARLLADSIGYVVFDTGAMYRSVTYVILQQKINPTDEEAISRYLDHLHFEVRSYRTEKKYYVNGKEIPAQAIRSSEVTSAVSAISALEPVRKKLCAIQRELAKGVNCVFEGRDMGTTVFPNAHMKIFLTADPQVRAERRHAELVQNAPSEQISFEQCLEAILKRDHADMMRKHSPLKQAEDAFVIDTSLLSTEEIVYKILEFKDTLKGMKKVQAPQLDIS